jgi:hypothetical protein
MKTVFLFLKRVSIAVILLFSLIQMQGCSSSKGVIKFTSLKYPASMSAFLYDQNRHIVMKGMELDSLTSFKYTKTFWHLAYGLIPLTKGESISNDLNAIVEKYKGDGIINLSITIEQGAVNKVYSFFMYLPSYIPILPSSANITISGEVVKLSNPVSSTIFYENMNSNYVSKENISARINSMLYEAD